MYIRRDNTIKMVVILFCFTIFFQSMFLKVDLGTAKISLNKLIFGVLILDLLYRVIKRNGIFRYPNNYSFKFVILWSAYCLFLIPIAMINGQFVSWLKLFYLVLLFFVTFIEFSYYLQSIDDLKIALYCFQCGIFVQALIGLYEHFTLDYRFTIYAERFRTHPFYISKGYPCAMQANPNDFALLMCIGFFISLFIIGNAKKRKMKILNCVIVSIYMYLIYLSESRSAFFFLALGIMTGIIEKLRRKINRKMAMCFMSISFAIVLFCVTNFERLYSLYNIYAKLGGTSDSTRIGIYSQMLKILFESFGFGSGYYLEAVHSFWVEILVDFGILIFGLFFGFYARLFIRMYRIQKSNNREISSLALCFSMIMGGFVIGSFGPASTLGIEWIGAVFAVMVVFEEKYSTKAIVRERKGKVESRNYNRIIA